MSTAVVLRDTFLAAFPGGNYVHSVFKDGSIVCDLRVIIVKDVLFDSGALGNSFISSDFVQQHSSSIKLTPAKGSVKLADNKTSVEVEFIANLNVEFIHDTGIIYPANISFVVFNTTGHKMIIGLPDIITHFLPMFVSMLYRGIKDLPEDRRRIASKQQQFIPDPQHLSDSVSGMCLFDTISNIQSGHVNHAPADASDQRTYASTDEFMSTLDLRDPWTTQPVLCEELDSIPQPMSFSGPYELLYLETSWDEARQKYDDLCNDPTHVNPDFVSACPDFVQFQRDIAVESFCPKTWEGLKDVDPIDIDTLPGLENMRHKPEARGIPRTYTHLIDNIEKEFHRLKTYFYRESRSSICSPLTIATKATYPYFRFCGDYRWINKHIRTGHYPIPKVTEALLRLSIFTYFIDVD